MRTLSFLLAIGTLLFANSLNAALLDSYTISNGGPNNTLIVSSSASTKFNADFRITRYIASGGKYEPIDWKVTLVYDNGGQKIAISDIRTVTDTSFSGQNIQNRTFRIEGTIPANYIGGFVYIKYESIAYGNNGLPISSLRNVEYSNTSYQTALYVQPPPLLLELKFVYERQGTSSQFYYNYSFSPFDNGERFQAFNIKAPGTVPVYCFTWANRSGTDQYDYCYTTKYNAKPLGVGPDYWESRTIAFYAYPTQEPGTVPVHRFYDLNKRKYYLSADQDQISTLQQNPNWQDEGAAFYAYPISYDPGRLPEHLKACAKIAVGGVDTLNHTVIHPSLFPFLTEGQVIYSPNRAYGLQLQYDGNLVLSQASTGKALWATNVANAKQAFFQTDAVLVMTGSDWRNILWDSGFGGPSNSALKAFISLQNNGDLVIYYPMPFSGYPLNAWVLGKTETAGGVVSPHFGSLSY